MNCLGVKNLSGDIDSSSILWIVNPILTIELEAMTSAPHFHTFVGTLSDCGSDYVFDGYQGDDYVIH